MIVFLKTCPFCQHEADLVQASNDAGWWIIRCGDPGCPMGVTQQFDKKDDAIETWNKRPPMKLLQWIETSKPKVREETDDEKWDRFS